MTENIIVTEDIKCPSELPPGLGWIYFEKMKQHAEKNKIAQIVHKTGEKDSYESLLTRSVRTAMYLQEIGIKKDDVVCLLGPVTVNNCVPFIASHFIGAIPTCIGSQYLQEEKKKLIEIVEPKVFFAAPEYVNELKTICPEIKIVVFGEYKDEVSFDDVIQVRADEDLYEPVKIDNIKDTAIMYFSSGSTGLPKAVCVSHFAVMVSLIQEKRTENPDYDVINHFGQASTNFTILEYMQYYWVSAGTSLSASLYSGLTRILWDKFEVSQFWQLVDKYKLNCCFIVPHIANKLMRTTIPENCDISSLVLLMIAGTKISSECILALREKLHPLATVMQIYAQTEFCGANTYYDIFNKDHRKLFTEKPDSVGLPNIGYTYKVVDLATNEIVGPNKQGELLVKGPTVMNGYYKMDNKNDFDEDGFFKTGDIVYYDEDYCFYIVDRIKGTIKYNFHIISSAEIETILLKHPAVVQAAAFGIPDPDNWNLVTAVVVPEEESQATTEEIRVFVDKQVDDYKRIRGGLFFVKSIPMTATGKVKTSALRSLLK